MRVVFDTNVWLDLLYFKDPTTETLNRTLQKLNARVYISEPCYQELCTVLQYDDFWGVESNTEEIRKLVLKAATFVDTQIEDESHGFWCKDEDDIKFLQLANSVEADYLLTKDHDLLKRRNRRAILPQTLSFVVLTPSKFVASNSSINNTLNNFRNYSWSQQLK